MVKRFFGDDGFQNMTVYKQIFYMLQFYEDKDT